MACDGLTLSSTVPTLRLESVGPELTLASATPELSLSSESCVLAFNVETTLTFAVVPQTLELVSETIQLNMTTPIPVGVGEANDGQNCGTGAGVYRDKVSTTLRFRTLQSLSDALTVAENDPECSVDFDIDPTQVLRWNVVPAGDLDGLNLIYSLPEAADKATFRLYRNGVRQRQDDAGLSDFLMSESGGAGTGFDTVVLTTPAPLGWELLTADYLVSA